MKRLCTILILMALCMSGCARRQPQMLPPSQASVNPKTPEEIALAEMEIRYAISLLLDRNYIVDRISQAGEQPASSFVAMGMSDYAGEFYEHAGTAESYYGYFDPSREAFESNFLEAIRILQKYYDFDGRKFHGFPTVQYIYNTNHKHKATAEYVQAALKLVGIPVVLQNQEWNTFLSTRKNGDFTMARSGWVADYTDPICFLDMWVSTSGNNDVQLGKGDHGNLRIFSLDLRPYGIERYVEKGTWSETYDVLIGEIKACENGEVRYRLMHLAEDMIMATGCIVPLFFYTDLYMLNPQVEGFYANPLGYKYFHETTVNGKGDLLPVCLSSEPESIDPGLNATVDGATMLSHLFAGLAKWDMEGERPVIRADCAAELPEGKPNPDGTVTYTYPLKENLTWSDGQPLTAQDFAYGWKRAAAAELGSDYGYLFEVIQGYPNNLAVTALDDQTLQVTLASPISYWNEMLAFPTFFPVRQDVAENESWANSAETYISNGAYTMESWKHDSLITLVRNEKYHDNASVTMDRIQFYLSDDANNMLTNYKNGDWLLIDDVPANEIQSLKAEYPDDFRISGQIGTNYLCFNANTPLLP